MSSPVSEVKESAIVRIAITRNSRKTRNFWNSQVISGLRGIGFGPIHKTITRNFSMTQVIVFFCTMLKTIPRNFSESTKAFNLENIVQVCLVSSRLLE